MIEPAVVAPNSEEISRILAGGVTQNGPKSSQKPSETAQNPSPDASKSVKPRQIKPKSEHKPRSGRPTKYKPAFCRKIIKFFDTDHTEEKEITHTNRKGDTWTEYKEIALPIPTMAGFAAAVGVDKSTLRAWASEGTVGKHQGIKDFRAAYTRARNLFEARIADLAARGFLNPAFSIFLAKNCMDWSDKSEVNHTGEMEHKHFFDSMLQRAGVVDSWATRPADLSAVPPAPGDRVKAGDLTP